MRLLITGQMFWGPKNEQGPLFDIFNCGDGHSGPYKAVVRSHYEGNQHQVLNEVDGFYTVGDAMEWIFDHQRW